MRFELTSSNSSTMEVPATLSHAPEVKPARDTATWSPPVMLKADKRAPGVRNGRGRDVSAAKRIEL